MSKSALLGKVLSQVGIFVVSALLAGILLLAIQANKLPGIIQKDSYFQDDDVTPDDKLLKDGEVEATEDRVTAEQISFNQLSDIDNKTHLITKNNENTSVRKTLHNKQNISLSNKTPAHQNPHETQSSSASKESYDKYSITEKQNPNNQQTIRESTIVTSNTNVNTNTTVAHASSIPASRSKPFTPTVSAAFGFSPVFFTGQSFVQDYFQNNACVFTPCGTIGLTFPHKNNFSYAMYLSAASSSLELNSSDIYQKLNLDFSTTLLLAKLDFSILHTVFTENNLLEAHLGTGVGIFTKPVCTVNELSFNRKNASYITLDFGLSFKHFFSDRVFISALCDVTYILPFSDRLILFQPAVTAGLNL